MTLKCGSNHLCEERVNVCCVLALGRRRGDVQSRQAALCPRELGRKDRSPTDQPGFCTCSLLSMVPVLGAAGDAEAEDTGLFPVTAWTIADANR